MEFEQAYMDTTKDKYYNKMSGTLAEYNDRNNAPLFNENIQQAVRRVMT